MFEGGIASREVSKNEKERPIENWGGHDVSRFDRQRQPI